MKTILKVLSAVALTGVMVLPVLADDATTTTDAKDQKDLKKVIEDQGINYVETAQKGITLSGYVDTSYTEQFGGRGTGFGGGQAIGHEFDTNNNNFNLNAVKIALEKALPDKNEWAAGFRIDTIMGSDAKYLTDPAFGFSSSSSGERRTTVDTTYPIALEQALVKFRIPVGNGLDIYAGKFVTFLGYEVIESPANLNFSRGLLFTNAIPLTHTGVYADYKFNDTVETKFGVVDGWNNSVSNPQPGWRTDAANDYPFGGKAIIGQINITAPGKNANICQSFYYAPSGDPGAVSGGADNGPVVVYDIWGNWSPTCVKNSALTLGFNVDLGYNGASGNPSAYQTTSTSVPPNTAGAPGGLSGYGPDSNTWYGVALYASYKVNKVLTLSARGEYLHEDPANWDKFNNNPNGNALGSGYSADNWNSGTSQTNVDDFSATLTASFAIWDNLLTRAEYRYDHVVNGANFQGNNPVGEATYQDQNEVSLEAVYSF